MLNVSGVDKENFIKYTESNPATYEDWSRTWDQETTGKENHLRSPYLDLEFDKAREAGAIPKVKMVKWSVGYIDLPNMNNKNIYKSSNVLAENLKRAFPRLPDPAYGPGGESLQPRKSLLRDSVRSAPIYRSSNQGPWVAIQLDF